MRKTAAVALVLGLVVCTAGWTDDPPKEKAKEPGAASGIILTRPQIERKLDLPIEVNFDQNPFEDCIKFLGAMGDPLPIVIDRKYLEDEGIDTSTPVTLKVGPVHRRAALELILEPLQLEWIIRHDVLHITTAAEAGNILETRCFPLKPLTAAGNDPEDLLEVLTQTVQPETWSDVGGPGSVSVTGSFLVIRQSQPVFREIVPFLDELATGTPAEGAEPAKRATSLRVYPLKSDADEVAAAIRELVAPDTWGTEGTIKAAAGSLLVRHNQRVHSQIRRILLELSPPEKTEARGGG